MWVWPERPPGDAGKTLGRVELDARDIDAVRQACTELQQVSPLIGQPAKVGIGPDEIEVPLEGVSLEYHAIRNLAVDFGRPLALLDVERAHYVCILGRDVLRKLNVDQELVGGAVMINGRRFRVVGVLQSKGSFFGQSQDDVVHVPYTTALKMYPQARRYMAFAAQAVNEEAVPEARAQIVNLLRRRHRLSAHQPNDFNIQTQDEILKAFNQMGLIATAVLASIVGISLLVGGIGIMNVMLVSVTERTREIGLRKAVGARRRDILIQFITEATTLSVIGGGLGVALGCSISALASLHPQMVDIVVPWWAIVLGFVVSAGTGIVFGLLPAVKASLLNPIDALRHE
jgi:putative ABC transport system permease protein